MFRQDVKFVFFNDTATTEIYTLSLHDALPIFAARAVAAVVAVVVAALVLLAPVLVAAAAVEAARRAAVDRKSTRLNSSHANISYAVFCLKNNREAHQTLPLFSTVDVKSVRTLN